MAKKKIKDLTLEEMVKICNRHSENNNCVNCPLNKYVCNWCECIANMGCRNCTSDLSKEIEVEEDKPQKCKYLRGCC